jgi:tRNA-specific 2-thiouridylase
MKFARISPLVSHVSLLVSHFTIGGVNKMTVKKALVLYSGGLDSILTVKLLQSCGVPVEAVHFDNPFHQNPDPTHLVSTAAQLGITLHIKSLTEEYLQLISQPPHGYGKRMNPCIDCRIYQLKLAKQLMPEYGASFLATGEVLDQRPNSQRHDALDIVERDSGVRGILLRPLSAQHLRPTLPELEGWVDRKRLLDLKGRGRTPQIELAAHFGITDYPAPAGGCLLTTEEYSQKVADLLANHTALTLRTVELLRWGRHLRLAPEVKIIVGKDAGDNAQLIRLASSDDFVMESRAYLGPVTLYCGPGQSRLLELAAAITAGYGRVPPDQSDLIAVKHAGQTTGLTVFPLDRATIRRYFVYKT